MLQNVNSIKNSGGEGLKGYRIIVCSGIIECISACILVLIKEQIDRWIVIVVTREEVVRETLDHIKEVSVYGIGIGGKEGIGTVVWKNSRVIWPKRSDGLFLFFSPKLCSGKKMEIGCALSVDT